MYPLSISPNLFYIQKNIQEKKKYKEGSLTPLVSDEKQFGSISALFLTLDALEIWKWRRASKLPDIWLIYYHLEGKERIRRG